MVILFEGLDGVGKTSQLQLLKQHIEEKEGFSCEIFAEPGDYTILHKTVQNLLKNDELTIDPITQQMLIAACRRETTIATREAEAEGKIVLWDRGFPSTLAYSKADPVVIAYLQSFTGSLKPNCTFIFSCSEIETQIRLEKRGKIDKWEKVDLKEWDERRIKYMKMPEAMSDTFIIETTGRSKKNVHDEVKARFYHYIERFKRSEADQIMT